MVREFLLFAILAFTASCEAKKLKVVPTHPYIYNVELKFKEDKINDYIVDSFFATYKEDGDKLLHCDITLTDLIRTIPTKKVDVSNILAALKELNLSFDNDDLNNFISNLNYAELKSIGFSLERIYKSISKTYFKDRSVDLLECLRILDIAEEFSVAYTFGTEEDVFKALQNGNFSHYNLVEIQNLIGAPTTLKEIFNVLGVKKLNSVALTNFVDNEVAPGLIQRGLTEERLKNFLEALGLGLSNYKDSKTFKKCYSSLTKDKSLAVAISENEIVTNDDSVVLKYLNLESYVDLTAKVVQGEGPSYIVLAENIKNDDSNNIIHIKINGVLPSFVDQVNNYADISNANCQYISLFGDQLIAQNIGASVVDDQLSVSKLFNTQFKKGNPLICEQKLYGLASINKYNSIIFDYLHEIQEEKIRPPLPPIHHKPEVIEALKEFLENIHANFNPCKYFNCSNDKEGNNNLVEEDDLSGEEISSENAVTNIDVTTEENAESENVSVSDDHVDDPISESDNKPEENEIPSESGNGINNNELPLESEDSNDSASVNGDNNVLSGETNNSDLQENNEIDNNSIENIENNQSGPTDEKDKSDHQSASNEESAENNLSLEESVGEINKSENLASSEEKTESVNSDSHEEDRGQTEDVECENSVGDQEADHHENPALPPEIVESNERGLEERSVSI